MCVILGVFTLFFIFLSKQIFVFNILLKKVLTLLGTNGTSGTPRYQGNMHVYLCKFEYFKLYLKLY